MASKALLLSSPGRLALRSTRIRPRQARALVCAVPRMQQQGEGGSEGSSNLPARRQPGAGGLSLWDPFGDVGFSAFPRMNNLMDEFNTLARAVGMPSMLETAGTPATQGWRALAVDVKDLKDKIEVHADVPGVKSDDIKIAVSPDHVLTLSAERKNEVQEGSEEEGTLRIERSFGSWRRSFRLPDNVDVDGIKASVKEGELKLTIPKTEVKAPEHREIKVETE